MGETNDRIRLVAILGTVAGLAALFWAVSLLGLDGSLAVGARPLGLVLAVPVLVVLLAVGLTWFVLRKRVGGHEEPQTYVECGACHRSILEDWRLCPYCGARVERDQAPGRSAHLAS